MSSTSPVSQRAPLVDVATEPNSEPVRVPLLPVLASSVSATSATAHANTASSSSAVSVVSSTVWPSLPEPAVDAERLRSPHILQKSVSMDSLDRERSSVQRLGVDGDVQRNPSAGASTEILVDDSRTAKSGSLSSPSSTMSLTAFIRSKTRSTRRRGASHSTTDNETSTQDESDFDRLRIGSKSKSRVRQRLLSFKSSKPALVTTAENIPLPSPANQNLIIPSEPSSTQSSTPPSAYPMAVKTTTRKGGRSRSFSVGAQSDAPSRPSVLKFDKRRSMDNIHASAIAVIGSSHCGKSSFIRKSLKKHDLSDTQSHTAVVREGDQSKEIKYTRRIARYSHGAHEMLLSVFEFTSDDWVLEDGSLLSAWATGLPRVDGIFVCYDASNPSSFTHVVNILVGYRALDIPAILLACKSDLENRISPTDALQIVHPYCGVIEASIKTEEGKAKMRRSIDAMLRLVTESSQRKSRSIDRSSLKSLRLNTPSTVILVDPAGAEAVTHDVVPPVPTLPRPREAAHSSVSLQESSKAAEDPPSLPIQQHEGPHHSTRPTPGPILVPTPSTFTRPQQNASTSNLSVPESLPRAPPSPSSPTRSRSMNDMLSRMGESSREYESDSGERISVKENLVTIRPSSKSDETLPSSSEHTPTGNFDLSSAPLNPVARSKSIRELSASPWVTFDELLDKLIFLATSGDDPAFIRHFFLTYRRFSTPRSVLLGMQKKMVELNNVHDSGGDKILASYTQMRICNLLEQWIAEYPSDFTVPGTQGALNAFIRKAIQHSHTLAYGSEFLPFLEQLPSLVDRDSTWSRKADFSESDESDSMFGDDTETDDTENKSVVSYSPFRTDASPATNTKSLARERRSSLPLQAISLFKAPYGMGTRANRSESHSGGTSDKDVITRLLKTATSLQQYDAGAICNEITRREADLFLKIEPRHWLRHTLLPGKKDPSTDPIARFNSHYNDLHEWAVSLILCHDRPKARAKQIEKFVEVSAKLRALNNYSGLRALITAVNQATYSGDAPMEIFKTKVELHKKYLSSDILLRTTGAHQSYRMALRNTKGPCIPSLEVHTSDLRRANEGNADTKEDDPSKINWAKYHMIGRFVDTTTQLQERCKGQGGYLIAENKMLTSLFDVPPMSYEMQQSRISQPDDNYFTPMYSTNAGLPTNSKEGGVIKRILNWQAGRDI